MMSQDFVCLIDYRLLFPGAVNELEESTEEESAIKNDQENLSSEQNDNLLSDDFMGKLCFSHIMKHLDEINFATNQKIQSYDISFVILDVQGKLGLEVNELINISDIEINPRYRHLKKLNDKLKEFKKFYAENNAYDAQYLSFHSASFVSISSDGFSLVAAALNVKNSEQIFLLSNNVEILKTAHQEKISCSISADEFLNPDSRFFEERFFSQSMLASMARWLGCDLRVSGGFFTNNNQQFYVGDQKVAAGRGSDVTKSELEAGAPKQASQAVNTDFSSDVDEISDGEYDQVINEDNQKIAAVSNSSHLFSAASSAKNAAENAAKKVGSYFWRPKLNS